MSKIIHNYFIDEAGDTALFGRYKKPLKLGEGGTSKFFMVGAAKINNPEEIAKQLDELRKDLSADPYLQGVPSFKKSSVCFHAKDDFHTVKREVFRLIESLDVEVTIVIRNKIVLINQAKFLFKETGKKLTEAMIYDDLLKNLLPRIIHRADENHILFAERGRAFSNHSLEIALKKAKNECLRAYGIEVHDNHFISQGYPNNNAGLQIVDYLLWAVQRLYERHEDYYFQKLRSKYNIIMDMDDIRNDGNGEVYGGLNNLTLDKIKT